MDKEKIIKELKHIQGLTSIQCLTFPKERMEFHKLINDVLILLEEQEAIEPIRDANCMRMFHCGACGEYVGFIDSDPDDHNEQDNYCRNCGRKVKWDAR